MGRHAHNVIQSPQPITETRMRTTPSHHFIFKAAQDQDSSAMKRVLQSTTIDIYEISLPEITTITLCAKAVDKAATYFLLSFGANKKFAVLGAAMSGNEKWLMELLERDNDTLLNAAARGAALSGNLFLATKLEMFGARSEEILFGAAIGKHFDWVDDILEFYSNKQPYLNLAAKGAAIANATTQTEKYRLQGASLNSIICGACIAGNVDYALTLINKNLPQPGSTDQFAYGLAFGGHRELTNRYYRELKLDVNTLLLGAAKRGDAEWAQSLLRLTSAQPKYIFFGATLGGHEKWMDILKRNNPDLFSQHEKELARLTSHQSNPSRRITHTELSEDIVRRPSTIPLFQPTQQQKPSETDDETFTLDASESDEDTLSIHCRT